MLEMPTGCRRGGWGIDVERYTHAARVGGGAAASPKETEGAEPNKENKQKGYFTFQALCGYEIWPPTTRANTTKLHVIPQAPFYPWAAE